MSRESETKTGNYLASATVSLFDARPRPVLHPVMAEGREMESWKDAVPKWFPIAAAALAMIVGGAQAKSTLDDHNRRLQSLETIAPEIRERLARIEGKLDAVSSQPRSAATQN